MLFALRPSLDMVLHLRESSSNLGWFKLIKVSFIDSVANLCSCWSEFSRQKTHCKSTFVQLIFKSLIYTSSNLRLGSTFKLFLGLMSNVTFKYFLINWCCKTLPIFKKRKETHQNKTTMKKKSLTQQESNPRPSMCKDNELSIAPLIHCWDCIKKIIKLIVFNNFVPTR